MSKVRITIKTNGSAVIEGEEGSFEIVDPEGNVFGLAGRTKVSLCRCGLSQKMPFCDSSHKGNFVCPSVAYDLEPKPQV